MNKIILKGRMTADAEMKNTSNGIEYCSFTVAVDRYQGKDKEKTTDFIPCKAWRQTAVFIGTYFGKGKEILIEGDLHVDKYEKDGENRNFTYINVNNVEFCGSKSDNNNMASVPTADSLQKLQEKIEASDNSTASDDDLPF